MFICDECYRRTHQTAFAFFRSYGRCEVCEERGRDCSDIPSSNLKPFTVEEPTKGNPLGYQ